MCGDHGIAKYGVRCLSTRGYRQMLMVICVAVRGATVLARHAG